MKFFRLAPIALFALSVSAQSNSGQDALLPAIRRGDTETVAELIERGVNPNITDEEGVPALMLATLFADVECVEVLLEGGANPNRSNAAGTPPLIWAMPDSAKARLLLEHGAEVNARSVTLGRTPLLVAATFPQSVDVLGLLIAYGADVHAEDASGANALRLAIRQADVGVVRFLVDRGLDPNEPIAHGRLHLPTIEYLMSLRETADLAILDGAARWQDASLITRWIEMGADVNVSLGSYGRTPLHSGASSESGTAAILEVLLENGADPNAETTEGERPLDWAFYRSDQARIDVLQRYGATRGSGPRQQTFPSPQAGSVSDSRTSVSRSVSLLLEASPPAFESRACITCHNNTLPAMAAAVARRKGIDVNDELVRQNLDDILAVYKLGADEMMQGQQRIGQIALTVGYVAMALAEEAYPMDNMTASFTHYALATQMPDGSWIGNGINRPPMEYSSISHTAMGVRVLSLYPIAGRNNEVTESLEQAKRWLMDAAAHSAEERAMRLLGLVWSGAPQNDIDLAIDDIIALQEVNGGWSQLADLETDAYATGLSLFALREAAVSVTGDTHRRGVQFLRESQYQDGSWLVESRSFPTQSYFESGFPFGRHQWISSAGTAWATMAIAATLPESSIEP